MQSALQSHIHLERMVGAPADEIVRVPRDASPEQMREVFTRLGMPETPDGYEFAQSTGQIDDVFRSWMKQTGHAVGLTKSQVANMDGSYHTLIDNLQQHQANERQVRNQADEQSLQNKYRNGYSTVINKAGAAARDLFGDENLDAALQGLEDRLGYAGTIELMYSIAERLGEGQFHSNDVPAGGSGFTANMSPPQARELIRQFNADKSKVAALQDKQHPDHKMVVEERRRLFQVAYPDAAAG